ncbi:MAG: hypothetical protein LBQ66_00710 [Planctomycetaceae bacterium]|nr:hypothetical protein [Planctomycetaceae bacterium]
MTMIIVCLFAKSAHSAQYAKTAVKQTPFVNSSDIFLPNSSYQKTSVGTPAKPERNQTKKTLTKTSAKNLPQNTRSNPTQANVAETNNAELVKARRLPQPARSNFREVQFDGELFDIGQFENEKFYDQSEVIINDSLPRKLTAVKESEAADGLRPPVKLFTPVRPDHVQSPGFLEYSDEYPDPRQIGNKLPYARGGISPLPYDGDRHAAIPEAEVQHRHHVDDVRKQLGEPPISAAECPLCKDDPRTPCGRCKMCVQGMPCDKTLCRHCVQPVSRNMNNFCDLTNGDQPCGTCDSCREHRSDPCEHADDGRGPYGEWNPYKEPRLFSVIPRPILDEYNNGARKFPVYYNPAPYYRHYWNPSLYTGYARPYSFRYTCPVCYQKPCKCDRPPFAGQVPFAYTCKFCNRNPCACAEDICDANSEMQPGGRSNALKAAREQSTRIQDADARRNIDNNNTTNQNTTTQPSTSTRNDQEILDLLNETAPPNTPTPNTTTPPRPNPLLPIPNQNRPGLDAPTRQPPNTIPRTGVTEN